MAAIPLVIITLDLVAIPLVVSTIMKGKPFQFQFLLCLLASFTLARVQVAERAIAALLPSPPSVIASRPIRRVDDRSYAARHSPEWLRRSGHEW